MRPALFAGPTERQRRLLSCSGCCAASDDAMRSDETSRATGRMSGASERCEMRQCAARRAGLPLVWARKCRRGVSCDMSRRLLSVAALMCAAAGPALGQTSGMAGMAGMHHDTHGTHVAVTAKNRREIDTVTKAV